MRALWKVTAVKATPATGLCVKVGPITAESVIEIFASEADKYVHVRELCFGSKQYRMRIDQKRKKVRVLAPLDSVCESTPLDISIESRHFSVVGSPMMKPQPNVGVAICDVLVKCDGKEAKASIKATLGEKKAEAVIISSRPLGAGLSIRLEDIGGTYNQRYRWRQNVLEIAARHPSLKRYLGDKEHKFPGQESKHFRVLVAEIVADAVCSLLVRRNVRTNPEEFEDADWDQYYAIYTKYMTQFLPTAHKLQFPESAL